MSTFNQRTGTHEDLVTRPPLIQYEPPRIRTLYVNSPLTWRREERRAHGMVGSANDGEAQRLSPEFVDRAEAIPRVLPEDVCDDLVEHCLRARDGVG